MRQVEKRVRYMADVRSKRCSHRSCMRKPSFSVEGKREWGTASITPMSACSMSSGSVQHGTSALRHEALIWRAEITWSSASHMLPPAWCNSPMIDAHMTLGHDHRVNTAGGKTQSFASYTLQQYDKLRRYAVFMRLLYKDTEL